MVASSAISAGAIVASGFGDANIRYVATHRAAGNHTAVQRAVRSSMGIHLALGSILAATGWMLAPAMSARLIAADPSMRADCLRSLRIACIILLVRAVESVCISVAQDLAARWKSEFPAMRIAGTYMPPFRDLSPSEETELMDVLNKCKPDFLWVGISTPRQELLMRRLLPRLTHGVLLGVGAAFDFHTGRIRDCSPLIKRLGFQWLHRLMQDPRRLWRRNLQNMTFLWQIALQLTGLKTYGSQTSLIKGSRAASPHPASTESNSSAAGSA